MPLTAGADSRPSGMNRRPGFATSASGESADATDEATAVFESRRDGRGDCGLREPTRQLPGAQPGHAERAHENPETDPGARGPGQEHQPR
jgi:hypothetical protein